MHFVGLFGTAWDIVEKTSWADQPRDGGEQSGCAVDKELRNARLYARSDSSLAQLPSYRQSTRNTEERFDKRVRW
jgi:hypothetical protein